MLPYWLHISILKCQFVPPTMTSSIRPFRGHLPVSPLSCAFCCALSLHVTLASVASRWHGFLMTHIDPALCQTSLVAFILQQWWSNLEIFLQEQMLFIRVWAENEPQVTEQLILPLWWLYALPVPTEEPGTWAFNRLFQPREFWLWLSSWRGRRSQHIGLPPVYRKLGLLKDTLKTLWGEIF